MGVDDWMSGIGGNKRRDCNLPTLEPGRPQTNKQTRGRADEDRIVVNGDVCKRINCGTSRTAPLKLAGAIMWRY